MAKRGAEASLSRRPLRRARRPGQLVPGGPMVRQRRGAPHTKRIHQEITFNLPPQQGTQSMSFTSNTRMGEPLCLAKSFFRSTGTAFSAPVPARPSLSPALDAGTACSAAVSRALASALLTQARCGTCDARMSSKSRPPESRARRPSG